MNRVLKSVTVGRVAVLGAVVGSWKLYQDLAYNEGNQLSDLMNYGPNIAQCATDGSHHSKCRLASVSDAQPGVSTDNQISRAIAKSRKVIQHTMIEQGIPGAQITVSKNGKIVWSEGIGFADVENDVPCSTDSVMRIASISKPLTAIALLQLWQKGKVDLDAPIQAYVPKFPKKTYAGKDVVITTRQLLSHLGGIRHYEKKEKLSTQSKNESKDENTNDKASEFVCKEYHITSHYDSLEESLELFAEDELLSEPGTKFNYTTHGWTLISAVIEKVSGEQFLTYMQRNVFGPLGMRSTGGEFHKPLVYDRARHYSKTSDGRLENVPYVDLSYKWAGGGLISTTEDLVKFGNAVLASYNYYQKCLVKNSAKESVIESATVSTDTMSPNDLRSSNQIASVSDTTSSKHQDVSTKDGRSPDYILDPATTKLMVKKTVDSASSNGNLPGVGYGLGWFVNEGEDGLVCGERRPFYFGHTGGAIGASSVLMVFPDTATGVVNQTGKRLLSLDGKRSCGLCEKCGHTTCECEDTVCGVVVCVIFNLQEVKGVFSLGTNIAKEFLL